MIFSKYTLFCLKIFIALIFIIIAIKNLNTATVETSCNKLKFSLKVNNKTNDNNKYKELYIFNHLYLWFFIIKKLFFEVAI